MHHWNHVREEIPKLQCQYLTVLTIWTAMQTYTIHRFLSIFPIYANSPHITLSVHAKVSSSSICLASPPLQPKPRCAIFSTRLEHLCLWQSSPALLRLWVNNRCYLIDQGPPNMKALAVEMHVFAALPRVSVCVGKIWSPYREWSAHSGAPKQSAFSDGDQTHLLEQLGGKGA
jgi:hypothetical protein